MWLCKQMVCLPPLYSRGLDGDMTIKGRWQNAVVHCSCYPHTNIVPLRAVMWLLQCLRRFKSFCSIYLFIVSQFIQWTFPNFAWHESQQYLIQLTSKTCNTIRLCQNLHSYFESYLNIFSLWISEIICSKSVIYLELYFRLLNVSLRQWTSLDKTIRNRENSIQQVNTEKI